FGFGRSFGQVLDMMSKNQNCPISQHCSNPQKELNNQQEQEIQVRVLTPVISELIEENQISITYKNKNAEQRISSNTRNRFINLFAGMGKKQNKK
ncbi:3552_t:CDS:1, partial [Dentiscutata heterogama]